MTDDWTIPTLLEQEMSSCVHFTGRQNKACKKGILYDELARVEELGRFGCALRTPCVKTTRKHDQPIFPCEHLRYPTIEEAQERVDEINKILVTTVEATVRIKDFIEKYGDWRRVGNCAGKMPCPICNNELHFKRSGYNGHVHAICSTPDCVSFME